MMQNEYKGTDLSIELGDSLSSLIDSFVWANLNYKIDRIYIIEHIPIPYVLVKLF